MSERVTSSVEMTANLLRRIVLAAGLGVSLNLRAEGFVSLPSQGFAVEGGVSAYRLCFTAGNFNARHTSRHIRVRNDECAVFPAKETEAPLPGFSLVTTKVHPVVMNNAHTNNENRHLGQVYEFVWRNAAATECIFGTRVVATLGEDADYDASRPGKQYFVINDIARAGFSNRPVEVAYSSLSATARPLYRVGRTFTSVQYRGRGRKPLPGYVAQPLTTPDFRGAINGVDAGDVPMPLPEQQSAALDDVWVTFTSYVTALDDAGRTSAASSMFYIKTTCAAGTLAVRPNAIRLRQTGLPFFEIGLPGLVPEQETVVPIRDEPAAGMNSHQSGG
jgi:hypothetical protein